MLSVVFTALLAGPTCDGILSTNKRACCPISCGYCGGTPCANATAAASNVRCCTEGVLAASLPCGERGGAPCTMPAELPKSAKPCASGLDNDLPYEACLRYIKCLPSEPMRPLSHPACHFPNACQDLGS